MEKWQDGKGVSEGKRKISVRYLSQSDLRKEERRGIKSIKF